MLGVARVMVLTLPFARITRMLGVPGKDLKRRTFTPEQLHRAAVVSRAIQRIQPFTPWDSNCLAQAIAAHHMLHRRNLPSTVYLGAALTEQKSGLVAHAWLRCGQWIITGAVGINRYRVVASFVDDPLEG